MNFKCLGYCLFWGLLVGFPVKELSYNGGEMAAWFSFALFPVIEHPFGQRSYLRDFKALLLVVVLLLSCVWLWQPQGCGLPVLPCSWDFQARILQWLVISFSRESSCPRDLTWVSCIAGRFFTDWATRDSPRPCYFKVSKAKPSIFEKEGKHKWNSKMKYFRVLSSLSFHGLKYFYWS